MNKSIKRKWLRALRGDSPLGVYEQTSGCLCKGSPDEPDKPESFCCLGVLVNEIEGFCEEVLPALFGQHAAATLDKNDLMPSHRLLDYCGLTYEQANKLAEMNDDGKTFAEIADHIEANL